MALSDSDSSLFSKPRNLVVIFSNYNPISPIKKKRNSKVDNNGIDRDRDGIKKSDAIIEEDEDDYKTVFLLSNSKN